MRSRIFTRSFVDSARSRELALATLDAARGQVLQSNTRQKRRHCRHWKPNLCFSHELRVTGLVTACFVLSKRRHARHERYPLSRWPHWWACAEQGDDLHFCWRQRETRLPRVASAVEQPSTRLRQGRGCSKENCGSSSHPPG